MTKDTLKLTTIGCWNSQGCLLTDKARLPSITAYHATRFELEVAIDWNARIRETYEPAGYDASELIGTRHGGFLEVREPTSADRDEYERRMYSAYFEGGVGMTREERKATARLLHTRRIPMRKEIALLPNAPPRTEPPTGIRVSSGLPPAFKR